jgi:hypothetical protein
MKLMSWWKPHYYCFVLTFLISIALSVRGLHGWDTAVVWWVNFLPVCCILYNVARSSDNYNLKLGFCYAVMHYCTFHLYHFEAREWFRSLDVDFWPLSLISFIAVTVYVFKDMRSHE